MTQNKPGNIVIETERGAVYSIYQDSDRWGTAFEVVRVSSRGELGKPVEFATIEDFARWLNR